MNPKKQKRKDRRRARKLAEEAWEAADAGNLDLAEKIIRRAVAAQADNPVLWSDEGVLFGLRQKDEEAAEAFRTALTLAPTFAEPYAHLAALRIRQGFVQEAVALQTQAVKHTPHNGKGDPRRDRRRGSLRTICGCFRRQPVGCVKAAAPGYHYSRDHLLPLETPRP